jgi:hypothetical protein
MDNKSKNKVIQGANGKLFINGNLIGVFSEVSMGVDMSNEKETTVLTETSFVEGQQVFESRTVQYVTDMVKAESSNVSTIAFNKDTKQAFVEFKNNTLYQYDEVDEEEFNKLKEAQSIGKYLSSTFLKKGFKYKKLQNTVLSENVLNGEILKKAFGENT